MSTTHALATSPSPTLPASRSTPSGKSNLPLKAYQYSEGVGPAVVMATRGDATVALVILTLVAAWGAAISQASSGNETVVIADGMSHLTRVGKSSATHINGTATANVSDIGITGVNKTDVNLSKDTAVADHNGTAAANVDDIVTAHFNESSAAHINDTAPANLNGTGIARVNETDASLSKETDVAKHNGTAATNVDDIDTAHFNESSAAHINDTAPANLNGTGIARVNETDASLSKETDVAKHNGTAASNVDDIDTEHFNESSAAHINDTAAANVNGTGIPRVNETKVTRVNKIDAPVILYNQSEWTTLVPPEPCELNMSIVLPEAVLDSDGSIYDAASDVKYPPGTFWLWSGEGDDSKPIYRGCPCLTGQKPCIRKCCLIGESVSEKGDCVTVDNPFMIEITNVSSGEMYNVSGIDEFVLLFGNPCRYGRYIMDPAQYPEDEFYIDAEGYAIIPDQNMTKHGPDSYCLDFSSDHGAYLPFMCFPTPPEEPPPDNTLIYTMYPVGMLVSIPFLLVTFLVYAVIPELRNLHGKSLMCHVSSLVTAYMFLAVVQLGGAKLSDGVCITSAFIIEFAFLATFFWLNIMCIDIFLTFSGLRPLRGSLRERERKKFFIYSLYAWGCPLIILIVCIVMDFAPGIPDTYLRPRFGEKKCWFSGKMENLVYFFGPVGALVICNVILFVLTAVKLIRLKRETAMLKKGDSRRHDDREDRNRFNLYLKLLIVMGVTWVTELISWAVEGPSYLWYITDIGNTLQGFFIFLIFVWKRKIRALLLQRFFPTYDITSTGSWNPWRNSRAMSPTKSSVSHGASTTATTLSVSSNNPSIKLQPLLNSKRYSSPAVP
ncbi:G-protein coupled receptor Mth2-like [Ischnura elegans]|uniref:G-protein coupled receptor Mth2-like n=1 Tax=Ischnura elegans TaxID=197161 RepID=UPI001ED8707B|nr:G-protein coupled receptor Mth2-like [Ischnura elegans]